MRTEDLQAFGELMRDVARSMRAKMTTEDIASYFNALPDLSFATVRTRLLDWRDKRRWFPTAAQIRTGADAEDDEPAGPRRFSAEWWSGVQSVEQRIAEEQRAQERRRALPVVDETLRDIDARLSAAARGCALHDDGSETAKQWERRYVEAVQERRELLARRASPAPEVSP